MIFINYVKKLEELGFPVGSVVVMIKDDPTGFAKKGEFGTVCHYTREWEDTDGCNVGVEFKDSHPGRHNCMNHCKNLHGRYVPHTVLSILNTDFGELEKSEQNLDFLLGVDTCAR